ncbi:MAG: family 78 glycoside hydrolase catalytic domain [Clostridia bacterium]|nr:family 78 glycoside hydrolase catalytic domain [Clostridia bacterium]
MKTNLDLAIRKATWILCPQEIDAPIIRRSFRTTAKASAVVALSALGFFKLYVNGHPVGDEFFRPSNSLFHARDSKSWIYPIRDSFTYRTYYSTIDITPWLAEGDNILEIALGNGWYRQTARTAEGNMAFGDRLGAIYALVLKDGEKETLICSDGTERCSASATIYNQLFIGEVYDTALEGEAFRDWRSVEIIDLPDTLLTPEDAPVDRIVRRVAPTLLLDNGERKLYDVRENISGLVSLRVKGKAGDEVHVRFAENMQNGELSYGTTGSGHRGSDGRPQIMEDVCICDGNEHLFTLQFVWHAFRYFEITGPGEAVDVSVIHSDTPVTSSYHSSSPELNWLYDAFLRTQLNNMHGGVPSDCPHRERLGYTGDGQVCARAAMTMLDSRAFYRKWIRDIFDSQDKTTGHVNHTAPFAGGGGGPGGWGCAAIIVPYQYFKTYGDTEPILTYYDRMKRWIGYLLDHSEGGLVVREEEGGWCLGDWCTLEKTQIPIPYVNTCYLIKSLRYLEEIATAIGKTEDIPFLTSVRKMAEDAVVATYHDATTGSFADGIQGADAFALWAGLGDERTMSNVVEKYKALGHFDTGFLCTEILCGLLLENGAEDVAFALLTSHDRGSFGYMMDHGATTLWERWDGDGSHDHPMFGASAGHLIFSLLGIGQKESSAGYKELVIAPKTPTGLDFAKGSVTLPIGEVFVVWERDGEKIHFTIRLPKDSTCEFIYADQQIQLSGGDHSFDI